MMRRWSAGTAFGLLVAKLLRQNFLYLPLKIINKEFSLEYIIFLNLIYLLEEECNRIKGHYEIMTKI